MVLVTFQCEKWGMSAKTYLFSIAGILFIAALCFAGTVAYENQFKQKFRKSITSFYGADSPRDPAADEHGGDHFPEESDEESQSDSNSEGGASNSVFTTDFLLLLAAAAIGGLQITYISSNHEKFSTHITVFTRSFIISTNYISKTLYKVQWLGRSPC